MDMKPLVIGDLIAEVPVIQGGMGVGISLSGLAGAVASCGGIGVISAAQIGYREPDFDHNPVEANLRALKEEIHKAKEKAAGGIIGVNIMTASRWYEKYVRAAVKAGADLIISGAGLPIELPALIGERAVKIAPIVSSLKAASLICRMWDKKYGKVPDLIVIEGPKAGGHLGFSYEQLEEAVDFDSEVTDIIFYLKEFGRRCGKSIPVVVGGGVYTREDMLHYLEMGASGVQIGTRFVTTEECDASHAYKQTYIDAEQEDIQIMKSPVGMPGRAIRNSFLKRIEAGRISPKSCHQCLKRCNPGEIPFCITDALINAVRGNTEDGLLFCGDNAWRAKGLEHVPDIMSEFRR